MAIRNIPALQELFPTFSIFAVLATVIGLPLSVLIGWAHLKRTQAWKSEVDIAAEANPYYYKLAPGVAREVTYPMYRELVVAVRALLNKESLLDPSTDRRLEELMQKLELLVRGGHVGKPRAKI